MRHTPSERAAAVRRHRLLALQCPECTADVQVGSDALIEGFAVQCPHCGCEAEVTQEFDEAAGASHWVLIDPLADYDESDARRD